MNEYMPDPGYRQGMPDTAGNVVKSRIRYMNIILTVMLAVIIIASIVVGVIILGISNENQRAGGLLKLLHESLNNIEGDIYDISYNADDIKDQRSDTSTGVTNYIPSWDDEVRKPVIYLYAGEASENLHVELILDDADMISMWPEAVQNGNEYSWDVCAADDGTIFDKTGNEYSYLFWEADRYGDHSFDEGFCVAGSDTAEFLRDTLAEMGLTPKEYNEFIVYWLPLMQDNAYNLITFEGIDPDDAYNSRFKLSVTGDEGNKADSVLRIMMIWKASEEKVEIKPQEFDGFERNGLTVVEWGGAEVAGR